MWRCLHLLHRSPFPVWGTGFCRPQHQDGPAAWCFSGSLVWPGIVTAIIFTFVGAWNELAASLVLLTTDAKQPLSVALTKFVGQYDSAWQYVFAVSVVAIIPVVILFSLIEKRLVGGLAAGSIK